MKRILINIIFHLSIIIMYSPSSATLLPFPSSLPSVSYNYDTILLKTWGGIKKRLIDPYNVPLVHRPRSEQPHDAVSEGVGYGMLLALYCNDQPYFNKIWNAAEQYMWDDNSKWYNWRVDVNGQLIFGGQGPASDAEQDIILALIFADALVKKGVWQPYKSIRNVDYATRAQVMINSFWKNLIEEGRYLRPGNMWGGKAFVNPGYFAPAFYRVFAEFEKEKHNWNGVIDQCYQCIAASPGYSKGLVPDWMQPDGKPANKDQLGYNAYADGKYMYKDGIRILWRLATDYLWYNEPRAKKFLDNAFSFIKSPERANFFTMEGNFLPPTDSFVLGNNVKRPRSEHSHLTVGMWATAAFASGGPEKAEPFSQELLKFYEGGDYWGRSSDPNNEDTLHNELYFDQFLAWFGASLISGVFTNLWEDFKDPHPEIPVDFREPPIVEPFDIDANKEPLTIQARFLKVVRWSIEIKHRDSLNASVNYSGSGEEINIKWNGISSEGKWMPQGAYYVTISARGMKTPYKKLVWLGRPKDLKNGNRLLVDDFTDGDLIPYIGSYWGSYTEKNDGKNGKTEIKRLEVVVENNKPSLHWGFRLDGSSQIGFNAYAALEWNCKTSNGNLNLTGLDTLIFSARALSKLEISVQFITSDINDYTYFEDSVTLTAQTIEYKLPVVKFKQRLGGSGRKLDLSKCTAIRFQVQNVDGTQNEIIMEKISFSGNLSSLYTSPPPYIPPEPGIGIKSTHNNYVKKKNLKILREKKSIIFEIPTKEPLIKLEIYSVKGNKLNTLKITNSNKIEWNYTFDNKIGCLNGYYIAILTTKEEKWILPLVNVGSKIWSAKVLNK